MKLYSLIITLFGLIVLLIPTRAGAVYNTFDIDDPTTYDFKIIGAADGDVIGHMASPVSSDINRDGEREMYVTTYSYIYAIPESVLDAAAAAGKGAVIDLADTSNYTIRILVGNYRSLTRGYIFDDIDGDGYDDLITQTWSGDVNFTDTGSVYVAYSEMFTGYTGTGNEHNLTTSGGYNFRIDGEYQGGRLSYPSKQADYNGDGNKDLVLGAYLSSVGASYTGVIYFIDSSVFSGFGKVSVDNQINLIDPSNYTLKIAGSNSSLLGVNSLYSSYNQFGDIDGDEYPEYIVYHDESYDNDNVYSPIIFRGSDIAAVTGTGNLWTLSPTDNHWIRFNHVEGSYCSVDPKFLTYPYLGDGVNVTCSSIEKDGDKIGENYFISTELLNTLATKDVANVIDLQDSNNYTIKIQGSGFGATFARSLFLGNFVGDERLDVALRQYAYPYEEMHTVIMDASRFNVQGTGNVIDLSNSANYEVSFYNDDYFFPLFFDAENDGDHEIMFANYNADEGGHTDNGVVYVVLNPGHPGMVSGSLETYLTESNITTTGTITQSKFNTLPNIYGFEYRLNNQGWESFSCADGACDSGAESYSWSQILSDGMYDLEIRGVNDYGMRPISTNIFSDSFYVDTVKPTGTLVIDSGSGFTQDSEIRLNFSASDATSGVTEMKVGTSATLSESTWESYGLTRDVTLLAEGMYSYYVQYKDAAGWESSIYSAQVIYDKTPPTDDVLIQGGAAYTNTRNVVLSFFTVEEGSEITHVMISENSDFINAVWVDFNQSLSYELSEGDGDKTVYVKYKDGAGNQSEPYSAVIHLDTTVPTLHPTYMNTVKIVQGIYDYYWTSGKLKIVGNSEPLSTVSITVNSDTQTCETVTDINGNFECTFGSLIQTGEHTVDIVSTDKAGNITTYERLTLGVGVGLAQTGEPAVVLVLMGLICMLGIYRLRERVLRD